MKITKENIDKLPEKDRALIKALLIDVEEINQNTNDRIYLNWIDTHTEYSPEWTEPCPDFYGMYNIYRESNPHEMLGIEMTLEDLDMNLCLLHNYVVTGWFEVTAICREDLEEHGFDTSDVSDEMMNRIAGYMEQSYCGNGFTKDLKEACEELEIPKLK